jgi:hypothetical protein
MPALLLALILLASPAYAADIPADQWERSLLDKKSKGQLPGPRPGQKCLWSEKLKACLWYTPGKWK